VKIGDGPELALSQAQTGRGALGRGRLPMREFIFLQQLASVLSRCPASALWWRLHLFKLVHIVPLSPHSAALGGCREDRGVTYLAVLCAVVLMGVSLTAATRSWQVVAQRDAEAELYFRGIRIKHAIEAYAADYEVRKGTRPNRYPLSLAQLAEGPKRYLPVVYRDPITGEAFEPIRVNGEIRGVRSRGKGAPLDRVHFHGATAYNQVPFLAEPPSSDGDRQGGLGY
jgi:type II secretory pathway pseudopilin PulG